MRWLMIVGLCVTSLMSACKPLAQRETVSEEQFAVDTLTRKFDKAVRLGNFDGIIKWIDDAIKEIGDKAKNKAAKSKVAMMEKVLHRKLLQGDKATVKALFDSYINKDILGINTTIANISDTTSDKVINKRFTTLTKQVYEVQAAWSKLNKHLSIFAEDNTSFVSHMDNFSSEYHRFMDRYSDWATTTEKELEQALRIYADKSGHPTLPKEIQDNFTALKKRLHQPWEIDN